MGLYYSNVGPPRQMKGTLGPENQTREPAWLLSQDLTLLAPNMPYDIIIC